MSDVDRTLLEKRRSAESAEQRIADLEEQVAELTKIVDGLYAWQQEIRDSGIGTEKEMGCPPDCEVITAKVLGKPGAKAYALLRTIDGTPYTAYVANKIWRDKNHYPEGYLGEITVWSNIDWIEAVAIDVEVLKVHHSTGAKRYTLGCGGKTANVHENLIIQCKGGLMAKGMEVEVVVPQYIADKLEDS